MPGLMADRRTVGVRKDLGPEVLPRERQAGNVAGQTLDTGHTWTVIRTESAADVRSPARHTFGATDRICSDRP